MGQVVINIKGNKGFTLVEILVSILLLTIVLLGVLQSLAIYTRQNINNLIRDEAVKIGQECVENLRNGVDCSSNITRQFRDMYINFSITAPNATSLNNGNNQIQVSVTYSYPPNTNHTYTLNSVVYKP